MAKLLHAEKECTRVVEVKSSLVWMLNTQILNLETVTCCGDHVCVVARHFVISGIGLEQTYDTLLLLRFALRLRNCHFNIMYDRLVLRALTTRAEIVFSVDRAWCFFFFHARDGIQSSNCSTFVSQSQSECASLASQIAWNKSSPDEELSSSQSSWRLFSNLLKLVDTSVEDWLS